MPRDLSERTRDKQKAIASKEWNITRIQDEMDRLLKIFSHMRECLENEMMEGMGYTKSSLHPKVVEQASQLAVMMDKIVSSKIRFDKSSKTLAESMTPEEEREACTKYIQSLEPNERRSWINNMHDWMARRSEIVYGNQNKTIPDSGDGDDNELLPDELAFE